MSEKPESNRRDFLKGRTALNSLRGKVDDALAESESAEYQPGLADRATGYLEQYSKNAMACEFELLFNLHQYSQSGGAAMEAFQLIDLIEDQMTVYRDHSEVSQVNERAFASPVKIEQRLFELISQSKALFEETGGAFDITSTPISKAWGFDRRKGELPDQARLDEALNLVGSQFIELDVERRTIRFGKRGVGIDLGGIGKGHALDRVTSLLESRGIGDFVIHGGQSSVVARGDSLEATKHQHSEISNKSPTEELTEQPIPESPLAGWKVGISHPTLPGVRLAEITLRNQALGTSGTGRQGFFHQGKRYGHIIDPRSGWPTSHFLSSTVISPTAAVSDALATAFFVMTLDEVAEYCESRPFIAAALVVDEPSSKNRCRLICFNLDDSAIRVSE